MRLHRRRRRLQRRIVKLEVDNTEIDAMVKRRYLEPGDRDDLTAVEEAANWFFSDAVLGVTS